MRWCSSRDSSFPSNSFEKGSSTTSILCSSSMLAELKMTRTKGRSVMKSKVAMARIK